MLTSDINLTTVWIILFFHALLVNTLITAGLLPRCVVFCVCEQSFCDQNRSISTCVQQAAGKITSLGLKRCKYSYNHWGCGLKQEVLSNMFEDISRTKQSPRPRHNAENKQPSLKSLRGCGIWYLGKKKTTTQLSQREEFLRLASWDAIQSLKSLWKKTATINVPQTPGLTQSCSNGIKSSLRR